MVASIVGLANARGTEERYTSSLGNAIYMSAHLSGATAVAKWRLETERATRERPVTVDERRAVVGLLDQQIRDASLAIRDAGDAMRLHVAEEPSAELAHAATAAVYRATVLCLMLLHSADIADATGVSPQRADDGRALALGFFREGGFDESEVAEFRGRVVAEMARLRGDLTSP